MGPIPPPNNEDSMVEKPRAIKWVDETPAPTTKENQEEKAEEQK